MRTEWVTVLGRGGMLESSLRWLAGSTERTRPTCLGLCPMALALALGATLAACGGTERVPDGDHFPGVSMIDNMEDGTQYILADNGRIGLWYTYNDATPAATQEPSQGFPMYQTSSADGARLPQSEVIPRACGGAGTAAAPLFAGETTCEFVARTWGSGLLGWGAGMGADLKGDGGQKNPIDASMYGGIGFFAIGAVPSNSLRVNLQDVRTTPEAAVAADDDGIPRCEETLPTGATTGRCNDHYGSPVTLSANAWQWYQIPFHCMKSGGWGYPASGGDPSQNQVMRSRVVGIQFQIQGPDPGGTGTPTGGAASFDFSIDNLSFLDTSVVSDTTPCTGP